MKKRLVGIVWIFVITTFVACSALKEFHDLRKEQRKADPAEYGYLPAKNVKRNISYAPGVEKGRELLKLDVHWNPSDSPQPIIAVIHGGAWVIGSKDDPMQGVISGYIANRGYVAVNINYRMMPAFTVEDCINDVFGAIVWAKEHAAEFNGDPERVGAVGFSAGGHLTGMVATAGGRMDVFKPTGHVNSKYDASVNAAVPFYGVFDIINMPVDVFPVPAFLNHQFERMVFNGKPKKNLDFGGKISPITYISDKTPPQLVICGDADMLKLYPQSLQYVNALEKAGREVEFMSVPGANHGFNGAYWTYEAISSHKAMTQFLDKNLK